MAGLVGREGIYPIWDDSCGLTPMFVREAAEGGFEESLHLSGGTGDGGFYICRVVGDGEGLVVLRAGFEDTAFVLSSRFVAILVGQVDLDAGEMRFESV
jgi:hypothetical protein